MDGVSLSQDEINALLNDMSQSPAGDSGADSAGGADQSLLTDIEKDAIGEVANISMGSSATTLYSLVNQKVNITTPVVTLATWEEIVGNYEKPCVFIKIKYTQGLDGTNILILKESDVKIITDLMMGGDGLNTQDGELSELHLSAICEAMNQMMGSSATSLSSMLGRMIDISPPQANLVNLADSEEGKDISNYLGGTFVKIAFKMTIGELVDSTIMQLYPIDFAKSLYDFFMNSQESEPEAPSAPETPEPAAPAADMGMPSMDMGMNMGMGMGMPMQPGMNMGMGMGMPMQPGMNMGMGMGMPMQMPQQQMQNVNIQPASFSPFSSDLGAMQSQENISLIKDVPLEVTVELGRTSKSISEILEFAPGTIIELDKIAGEPVDVLVNGKLVAKGEVVVIEENFGVRVTEIIN